MRTICVHVALPLLLILGMIIPCVAAGDEQDVMEAVFRYQFEHVGARLFPSGAGVYFLSVRGKDPDDALLRRFSSSIPQVRKESQSYLREADWVVVDRQTGKRGAIFFIKSVSISNSRAEVRGGYYEHGKSASENTYHLRQVEGRWVVEKDIQGAIS